jgi:hypothetical protein
MSAENEIKAMGAVSSALQDLDDEARARVLHWAMSHYKVAGPVSRPSWAAGVTQAGSVEHERSSAFESFADLFNAAGPKTERDKAMVAAYWVQICENAGSFQSQSLNDLLKNLGHGVGNITEALNQLKDDRPALILQLKKSGSSRQARKTYKLTLEGSKRVEGMTQSESTE